MIKGVMYKMHPAGKIALFLGIVLFSLLLFYLIGLILAIVFFDFRLTPDSILLLNDLSNPGSVSIMKFFQAVQSVGLFVVPPFVFAYLAYHKPWSFLCFDKKIKLNTALLVILFTLAIMPFSNFLAYLNSSMQLPGFLHGLEQWMKEAEESATRLTEAFLSTDSPGGLILNLFVVAVIPALGEELLFRGVLQRVLIEWTKKMHLGVWLSAILFSAIHFQFYGFFPRLILGLAFGYLLEVTGSLWFPIIAHFLNNGIGVLLAYSIDKGNLGENVEQFGNTPSTIGYAFLGLAIALVCFYLIVRERKRIL